MFANGAAGPSERNDGEQGRREQARGNVLVLPILVRRLARVLSRLRE